MRFADTLKYTKSSLREVLGAEVRAIRKDLGVTQRELAATLGSHYNAVAAAETGSTPISPERIIAMLITLGVEPERIGHLVEYALS